MVLFAETSLRCIPGVGEKTEQAFFQLGIKTLQDCLWHFPLRYENRASVTPIADLISGVPALVYGAVIRVQPGFHKKAPLKIWLEDNSGVCELVFFKFTPQHQARFKVGSLYVCYGTPLVQSGQWQMSHPEYRPHPADKPLALNPYWTPVYPTQKGLAQSTVRSAILWAVRQFSRQSPDYFSQAIQLIHEPPIDLPIESLENRSHPACQRLILEELMVHQLVFLKRKKERSVVGISLCTESPLLAQFLANLPFQLTHSQKQVWIDIAADLSKKIPMCRLLQGDVGSGKTVIAIMALLAAVASKSQGAFMVPTEVLANQHYERLCAWLNPLGLKVILLKGKQKAQERRSALVDIANGTASIIVGTHALFQEAIVFHSLALVVVDEQHRFGVHQRWALLQKGAMVHQLSMTATPIPRTLTMATFGDMDFSILHERPRHRKPIQTSLVSQQKRGVLIERLSGWVLAGRQCYWVCTLVEESETLNCEAAENTEQLLKAQLPQCRVGLVHGKMPPALKQGRMQAFSDHGLDILVATTVIEVGIDVPNASIIVIDNAERLGLAQLHQLRGRVGRGPTESHCILLYQNPLSKEAKERLAILRESEDGFLIAEKDFQLRGPGEWLGTKQSGLPEYKIANLLRDAALLPLARENANSWVKQGFDEEPLIKRWLFNRVSYTQV